jgi:cytochrome c-type biogenesis protein CcmF
MQYFAILPPSTAGDHPQMLAEIGHFALILTLLVAIAQAVLPMLGAIRGDAALMAFGRSAAALQALLIAISFGCLMTLFGQADFSVKLVANHSALSQPLPYRLAATWGNHEGSMLLWVLVLSIYGAGIAKFGDNLRVTLQARILSVQAMISVAFLAFALFTSNPFERLFPVPLDGAELNPLLQDPGLVFHPPLLYLGYVGFSVTFSFAVAALLEGRADPAWARWMRPWVLAAWVPLTCGITLGSFWAYYELGWGGWWFWDPVENASFMPWLIGTALLHSATAASLGIGLLPEFLCRAGLAAQKLRRVLPDWELPPQAPLRAEYPADLAEDARVRAFVDFLAANVVPALAGRSTG